jgi:hypothetical protein
LNNLVAKKMELVQKEQNLYQEKGKENGSEVR